MTTTPFPLTLSLREALAAELEMSIQVKRRVLDEQLDVIEAITRLLVRALDGGYKVLLFGNGGSAADSQHIAGELIGRFRRERAAWPAIALSTDTSVLTALANDYGFETVFARQIEALGQPGDVAIAISTSGSSPNVLRAAECARELGLATVGFTGQAGGALKERVDLCFCAPSTSTSRIQEAHLAAAHAICELVERELVRQDGRA
jgi:D-sedoheptulose 7-phosphate isomerase